MPTVSSDSPPFREFATALGARDPKTVATYLTTVRDFVAWLATQPAGTPFHLGLVTETAVRGYMDSLSAANRAPRTRSKALSALRRFCQWAVDEGHLRRNPARSIERPTVVSMAPTELSDKQRFVLKTMVEQHATPRFAAIFALGYWAGLRISERSRCCAWISVPSINGQAVSRWWMPKEARRERLICTIWPGEHSMTICTQQRRTSERETLRVSLSSPVNGLPGCGNGSALITFLRGGLSISGCSSNDKEPMRNGS